MTPVAGYQAVTGTAVGTGSPTSPLPEGEAPAEPAREGWVPDVMLVDIGFPGMDGYEFARRARQLPGMEGVLTFAVTGYGADADVRSGREVGFAGHFVKPVNVPTLIERIREWAGEVPVSAPEPSSPSR